MTEGLGTAFPQKGVPNTVTASRPRVTGFDIAFQFPAVAEIVTVDRHVRDMLEEEAVPVFVKRRKLLVVTDGIGGEAHMFR